MGLAGFCWFFVFWFFFKVEISVKIDDLSSMSHLLEIPQKTLSHHDGQNFTQECAILKISLFNRRRLRPPELIAEASPEILSKKEFASDL